MIHLPWRMLQHYIQQVFVTGLIMREFEFGGKIILYKTMKNVDYSELKKSEKFTPALYHEKNGVWEGGSTSQFSPVMTFKLWERFSNSFLEVSESIEINGKRTFGYDDPIVYKRLRAGVESKYNSQGQRES